MGRTSRNRLLAGVVIFGAFVALYMGRAKAPRELSSQPGAEPEPSPQVHAPASPIKLVSKERPSAVAGLPETPLLPDGKSSTEAQFRARIAETRAALLQKTKYPLESRPLAQKTDLLLPHHVDPMVRGLGTGGKVTITQHQDRVWVAPGQPAVVTISAVSGSGPAAIDVSSTTLTRRLDGKSPQRLGEVKFADDGQAPDEIAGDGVYTGLVSTPTDGTGASIGLSVTLSSSGETGTLAFEFVQTAAAPASFTGSARDALEQGSVAIYVGVSVQHAGTYEIQGRLYDSTGAPVAYMRFLDVLSETSTEVRLLGFGKVILDEGAVPPFVLRDVEGWKMDFGGYPDRELMADWVGPYTTANYSLSQISSADYAGPDKQQKIAALNSAETEGVNNIRSGAPATQPAPAAQQ